MAENLANIVLGKFSELNDEYNAIIAKSETDQREYNDYCNQSDEDLSEKLAEIRAKISRVNEFMEYARAHATDIEEAEMAFETEMDALEALRSQINPASENDYHAETLYTKASAQKLVYEAEIERTTKKITGSKVQAKRMLDHQSAELDARREKHAQEFRAYIASEEFKNYIKSLSTDAAAFNSSGTSKLPADTQISLGQRRVKLPVPMEFDEELSLSTGGVFNSAAKTIGVPFSVDINGGCALYLEYDKRNESYMLGGLQRFLLNILKYYGSIDGIFFADGAHYSADSLGHIAALSKGINSIIDNVPENAQALKERYFQLKSQLSEEEGSGLKRVFVFHNFPAAYDDEMRSEIADLARNAEKYRIALVVTHSATSNGAEQSADDVTSEGPFKGFAHIIKTLNGGFYIEKTRDSLFWYSAPSDLPGDIRQTFIEQRRRNAAQTASAAPVNALHNIPSAQPAPQPMPQPVAAPAYTAPAASPAVQEVKPVQPVNPVQPAQPAQPVQPVSPVQSVQPAQPVPQPVAAVTPPIAQEPAAPEKDADADTIKYNKGTRTISALVVGTDTVGSALSVDLESVMFICANARAGRESLLRSIVGNILERCHPDDVELWLGDFNGSMGALSTIKAPHIRYSVRSRSKELARAFADRLLEVYEKRVKRYSADASAKDYSPTLVALVDGFNVLSCGLPAGYAEKLHNMFEHCAEAGMRFVLADDRYTINGAVPQCLTGIVRQGIAMSSSDENAAALFDGVMLTASDKASVANIPLHHAFIRKSRVTNGSALCFAQITELYDEEKLGALCEKLCAQMSQSSAFEWDNAKSYLSKRYVALCDNSHSFEEARDSILERKGGTKALYIGTPCSKLAAEQPIEISNRFGENVLLQYGMEQSNWALCTAAGAAISWALQGGEVVLGASYQNEMLSTLADCEELSQSAVLSGLDEICDQLKQIKSAIESGASADRLVVIFGADVMLAEMSTLTAEGFGGRYDARGELAFVLSQGARLGYHFLLVSESEIAADSLTGFYASVRKVLVTDDCGRVTLKSTGDVLAPYSFDFANDSEEDYLF